MQGSTSKSARDNPPVSGNADSSVGAGASVGNASGAPRLAAAMLAGKALRFPHNCVEPA